MTDLPETLTRKAFADHQGWSPSYVTKLAQAGRLVFTDDNKHVRVVESLERIAATADPARRDVEVRWAEHRQEEGLPPATDEPQEPVIDPATEINYQSSRARREHYAAQTAHIEYEKLIGNLAEVSDVRAAASEAGALIRTLIENLPAQLAPELAAETDEARVQALLVERMEILLNNVSELIERAAG